MDQVTDDELAAVLGHEIAHVAANHRYENSKDLIMLTQALMKGDTDASIEYAHKANDEAEADRIGILYAALAGYDPYAASGVWGRLARGNRSPWSYFRTHPSESDRELSTRMTASQVIQYRNACLLYTSPSPRDRQKSRMPSSA